MVTDGSGLIDLRGVDDVDPNCCTRSHFLHILYFDPNDWTKSWEKSIKACFVKGEDPPYFFNLLIGYEVSLL